MKLNNILDFIDQNKATCTKLFLAIIVISVGVLGYGIGVTDQASYSTNSLLESSPARVQNVLGDRVSPFYVNPFERIDLKEVAFPIAQLKACRNYEECRTLCSRPANFQSCTAWSNSLE
jgi:hypothetical protein